MSKFYIQEYPDRASMEPVVQVETDRRTAVQKAVDAMKRAEARNREKRLADEQERANAG